MDQLKLVALDAEDLEIISAHLQDAVLRVADLAYVPNNKRFACIANRFNWEGAENKTGDQKPKFERRRTAIRFERVLGAQLKQIDMEARDTVLELLAIGYEPAEAPEGHILLYFAGGATIRLHVECVEAEMNDLGAAWETPNKPDHGDVGDD